MPHIIPIQGDLTRQAVDAVVNAANTRIRGGGGVDGAIHRVGGPAVLQDCVERFPDGLATGDAGWTTAGDLPARWVIHAVGPDYGAGQRDPDLLASCYRRALEIADELGARTVAFPLISTGIFDWPHEDAVRIAIAAIARSGTRVEEVHLVSFDEEMHALVQAAVPGAPTFVLLRGVGELHRRGYETVRVYPGVAPTGLSWRLHIADGADLFDEHGHVAFHTGRTLHYTSGAGADVDGHHLDSFGTAVDAAEVLLAALPHLRKAADPAYASWFERLLTVVEREQQLPVAFADDDWSDPAWRIGWDARTLHPAPPAPPSGPAGSSRGATA